MNNFFNDPQYLAGLAMAQGATPTDAFQQAALIQQQQQKAQAEQAQFQQQQYLQQVIPQLLQEFDPQNPREFLGKLVNSGLDPKEAVLLMKALMPEQDTVKEDIVFNPVTGEAIRKQNINGKLSGFDIVEPQLAGGGMNQQMQSGNPQMPYETPFERKERAKLENDELQKYRDEAKSLNELVPSLSGLEEALNKFNTGTYGEERLNVGKFTKDVLGGDLFGINPEAGEYIKSQSARLVMPFIERNKGAASDTDMELFLNTAPKITNTPENNKRLVTEAQAIVQRSNEKVSAAEAYKDKFGTLKGFEQKWYEYTENNRIFKPTQNGGIEINKDNIKNWKPYIFNDISLLSESELRKIAGLD